MNEHGLKEFKVEFLERGYSEWMSEFVTAESKEQAIELSKDYVIENGGDINDYTFR